MPQSTAVSSNSRNAAPRAPFRQRLSTRIIVLSAVALTLVLSMISGTLWLSWQLEGAGAAINDAGSLRMRANAVAIALWETRLGQASQLDDQIHQMDATLRRLRGGDPARPLFLPNDKVIHAQFVRVAAAWQDELRPAALHERDLAMREPGAYIALLPGFVAEANRLVSLIEHENSRKTAWLRMSQLALAALSCVGTAAIVYMLYLWFVVPVQRLQDGLSRIEAREFDTRLPVNTEDEFGQLANGFNRMVAELQALYLELEARVEAKTAQLAAQNRELALLYEMAACLNSPETAEVLCHDFLTRLMREFNADGGTVRVISAEDNNLHLLAAEGLTEELANAERCMSAHNCICGVASFTDEPVIGDLRIMMGDDRELVKRCVQAGFVTVAAFAIVSQDETLGTFSLHFKRPRQIPASEIQLLRTLGRHLGVALKNRRLVALARQLAVSEERNLVAQGLHDSIAQGLSYLKMQVQLLGEAGRAGNLDEIRELVPLLSGGVEESYQDVRELLLNFRTRIGPGALRPAVEDTVARFRRQSEAEVTLDYRDEGGPPLPSDQQLQVLFILQEALSNVRKHAEAQSVHVTVVNGRDFQLVVEDDGIGYEPAELDSAGEAHVGFHIMRERAKRLAAALHLDGSPGHGARVELILGAQARMAA